MAKKLKIYNRSLWIIFPYEIRSIFEGYQKHKEGESACFDDNQKHKILEGFEENEELWTAQHA